MATLSIAKNNTFGSAEAKQKTAEALKQGYAGILRSGLDQETAVNFLLWSMSNTEIAELTDYSSVRVSQLRSKDSVPEDMADDLYAFYQETSTTPLDMPDANPILEQDTVPMYTPRDLKETRVAIEDAYDTFMQTLNTAKRREVIRIRDEQDKLELAAAREKPARHPGKLTEAEQIEERFAKNNPKDLSEDEIKAQRASIAHALDKVMHVFADRYESSDEAGHVELLTNEELLMAVTLGNQDPILLVAGQGRPETYDLGLDDKTLAFHEEVSFTRLELQYINVAIVERYKAGMLDLSQLRQIVAGHRAGYFNSGYFRINTTSEMQPREAGSEELLPMDKRKTMVNRALENYVREHVEHRPELLGISGNAYQDYANTLNMSWATDKRVDEDGTERILTI